MSETPSQPAAVAPPPTNPSVVRIALVFYGVVSLFALGYALFSGDIGRLLGERAPTAGGMLGALGVGLLLVGLTRVAFRAWGSMRAAAHEFAHVLGPIGVGDALLLALLSGFAEELLFRGALWVPLALPGTTCLFALVHVRPKRALWIYPVFALLAGLLLGLLRQGTESVVPPMIAHFVVNALNLIWIGKHHAAWTTPEVAAPADPAPDAAPAATEPAGSA